MTLAVPPQPSLTPARGFAEGYDASSASADEMVELDGSLRAHWGPFVSMMDDLGRDEIMRRWEQARRLIRENGITHNVYGDPNGLERPWNLDLIPLLIPDDQWKQIEAGLAQRARLFDRLLADLYGPARSVVEGWLPPELVYANPNFLRPCHGIRPPKDRWLHLYAADIIRTADGQFRVLADRTQAPSGAGYTLENRIVLSRVLPTAFRQCNVHRLAPFFQTMRQTLLSLVPASRENPRVVLLTPGPYNETYFEHAYLARYLGYTLVQGNDLTVRDAKVYLKTLGGLQRVDVILRRVDDDYCDPLELYTNSFLGVPGLIQAVREGNVAVANAIGSGVLQAPGLLSFLPTLSRNLLGEELLLPSVETWWCGRPDALRYVLENLDTLVIKPAFPTRGGDPVFGRELAQAGREALAAKISARPWEFVAQEQVDSQTAPVLLNDRVQPRRVVMRAYLTAKDDTYEAMPGGLTRVTASSDSLVVSLQKGGGSKDTWVLADGPVSDLTLLPSSGVLSELSRGGGDLPSRVADDLFWLGRYIQRAEAATRLARCVFQRLVDPTIIESPSTIDALVRVLLNPTPRAGSIWSERRLAVDVFGKADMAGLRAYLSHVINLARALRDRISVDAWRILQSLQRNVIEFDPENLSDDQLPAVLELLNKLVAGFLAFAGVATDSMTRGQSWRFLEIGQRVERALAMNRLIRIAMAETVEEEAPLLDAILEIGDSSLTYRRRYLTHLDAPAVVDLLVADESNPRAIAFQIAAIVEHLNTLPREASHPHQMPERQIAMKLLTTLRLADLLTVCKPAEKGRRDRLIVLLSDAAGQLGMLSELLSQVYFSHASVSRRLPTLAQEGNT